MKQLMQNTRDFGKACEGAACDYLLKKGYKIKERNFTVKGGEIDIVAEDWDYIVFVEVKARRQGYDVSKYGRPSDAVNEAKKAHFRSAVREYLYKKGSRKKPRIDVIEIYVGDHGDAFSMDIKHYIAAF